MSCTCTFAPPTAPTAITRVLWVLFALICLGTCSGAKCKPATPSPSSKPTTPPATRSQVPVVYTDWHKGTQLTPERTELILRAAQESRPQDRALWFVYVPIIDRYEISAMAFYEPDETSPRVRKGRYADVHIRKEAHLEGVRVVFGEQDRIAFNQVGRYAQVSPAGSSFPDKLEVPAPKWLPFPVPWSLGGQGPLSDPELVRLVDFARGNFSRRADDTDPICSIRRGGFNDKGAVDRFIVSTGVEDLVGSYIEVRRRGSEFEVTDSGAWADSLTHALRKQ